MVEPPPRRPEPERTVLQDLALLAVALLAMGLGFVIAALAIRVAGAPLP